MFTENWARFYGDWKRWLEPCTGQPVRGIEIGVYEGRSTRWLFENVLTHPDAELICIDPFAPFDGLDGDYRKRFRTNTGKWHDQIYLYGDTSANVLAECGGAESIDFIIVDGSHRAADVLFDAVVGWNLLKRGGVMIFDDYAWTGQGHAHCTEQDKPRMALDAFLEIYQPEVLHQEYQLIVRKP